jgi:hypothetical protein
MVIGERRLKLPVGIEHEIQIDADFSRKLLHGDETGFDGHLDGRGLAQLLERARAAAGFPVSGDDELPVELADGADALLFAPASRATVSWMR